MEAGGDWCGWTVDLLQDYDGNLTWVAQEMKEPSDGFGGGSGEDSGEDDGEDSGESGGNGDNETEGGNTSGGNESGEGSGGSGNGGNESGDGTGTGSDGTTINIEINNVGGGNSGAVIGAPTDGWVEGSNTFTVTCEFPCVVAVSNDGGSTYTRLTATATETENTYRFTVQNMTSNMVLAVVLTGDVNGDGKVNNTDQVRLKAYLLEKIEFSAIESLSADTNNSGGLSNPDLVKLKAVLLDKTNLSW